MHRLPLGARRLLILVLTLLTTSAATWMFCAAVRVPWGVLAVLILALYAVLFFWISLSFWLACAGFLCCMLDEGAIPACRPRDADTRRLPEARTAIVMPIYNEDPRRVLAGLRATYESLLATGQGDAFDFFLLSDTTDPDLWLAEELAWARLNQELAGPRRVFYRHRSKNVGRKAGNIADFCERFGANYRYMVVLDADSVMSGATLVELVRRMEADADLGILQAPPVPVNRVSMFARCQQFAAHVYGPIFLAGYSWWAHVDGNYWGHNAIIRLAPFMRHCGLSPLPGTPPLGGEILSHDFVEAALMRRAGLKVCLAQDLGGSYEEVPPTLIGYAQRDQRWCQGNMQHIRLVFSCGLGPMSRLHMGMGAMAYLSSPLWLLFMILSAFTVASPWGEAPGDEGWRAEGVLFAATMALLLLPKFLGYVYLLFQPGRLRQCGGAVRAAASMVLESVVSILVAPIMMAFHVVFVISTLFGLRVEWDAQERSECGLRFLPALRGHWKQTMAGVFTAAVVLLFAPTMALWLAPVYTGLILSIPLSMLLGSVRLGQALTRARLLVTPAETMPPDVLVCLRKLLEEPIANELMEPGLLFARLLSDPAFAELHGSILQATDTIAPAAPRQARRVEKLVRTGQPLRILRDDRRAVQGDPAVLRSLRMAHWTALAS